MSNSEGALRLYEVTTGRLLSKIELEGFTEFEDADFALVEGDSRRVLVNRDSGVTLHDLAKKSFEHLSQVDPGGIVEFSGRPGLFGFARRHTSPQSGVLSLYWLHPEGSAGHPGTASDALPLHPELSTRIDCSQRPDDWTLSRDGKTLAISYYPSNDAHVIDLEQRALLGKIPLPRWGSAVALSPDGKLLAVGGEELRIFATPTHDSSQPLLLDRDTRYGNNIHDIVFSPTGDLLVTSAYDGKARSYVLSRTDDGLVESLPSPEHLTHGGVANVYGIDFADDGRSLVTSSGDQTLKIWIR